jgi:C1A family cysteine protease
LRGTTPHVRPSEAAHKFGSRRKRQSLPVSVDWRSQSVVGPVKDQLKCGSCYSFSSTGALESHRALKYGNLVPLNVQQTLDCSYSYKNKGCDGGHPYYVYSYLRDLTLQRGFLARDNCYPYSSGISLVTGTCNVPKSNLSCAGIQVKGFSWLDNEDDMQYALANIGPVVVLMDVSQSSFQYYKSGVYSDTACSSTTYNHAMLAIGYGTENEKNYWLIQNSWGTGWGDEGYVKVERGKNMCAIANFAAFPVI